MSRLLAFACVVFAGCGFSLHLSGSDAGGNDDDASDRDDGAIDQSSTPWLDGWVYRRAITLNASQIEAPGNNALSAFPVMLALADPDLTHARPDRADVVFTADDATTPLAHELETFDSTTLTAWVKIPSLSATVDTTIYVYYGNPTAPSPAAPDAVWTESFRAVYHMQQDPGPNLPDQIRNSASNTLHGTAESSFVTADSVTSPFGRAIDFNGSSQCITLPAFDVGNQFTISVWMNMNAVSQIRSLVSNSQDNSTTNGFRFFVNSNGSSDRKVWLETGNGIGGTNAVLTASNAITTQTWEHVAVIVDRTLGAATIMIDGAVAATDMTIRDDFTTTQSLEIGRMKTNNPFDGMLDEMEIASTKRSTEWILTAYRNQRTPSAFYTVGTEQTRP